MSRRGPSRDLTEAGWPRWALAYWVQEVGLTPTGRTVRDLKAVAIGVYL